jgi:hypothetical protein
MSGNNWSRNDKIALISLSVAVVACIAALIVVPEFRKFVGLDSPPSSSPTPSNIEKPLTDNTSGNTKPTFTPTPKATVSSIPSFEGYIGDKNGKKKFFDFLSDNERRIVNVDVNLSDEQMKALKEDPVGEKTLWIDLTYKNDEGFDDGAELLIDLSGGEKDFYLDERATSQRIQSYLKIVGMQGPQMGIFSVRAIPVSIESIR